MTGTAEWLGIPFGSPPVKSLRFAPPQPAQPWSGVLDASDWKPFCPQHSPNYPNYDEDCLYLNVWRPLEAPPEPLPVMLYFCGGAFVHCGAGKRVPDNVWDGNSVVNHTAAVVIVTINYRVDVFGFLGGEKLRALSSSNSTGNQGFQDQILSMHWVQQNAASFGGDPTRVTIFGESAGAACTSNHLASLQSSGLFHRAIIESGPLMSWTSQSMAGADVNLESIAKAVGCPLDDSIVPCLQAAPIEPLLAASDANVSFSMSGSASRPAWTPVVDGVVFSDAPDKLMTAGTLPNKNIPTIMGFNTNEGTLFLEGLPRDLSKTKYAGALVYVFGVLGSAKVAYHYNTFLYPSAWWALSAVLGDAFFICPTRRMARDLVAHEGADVFLYHFNYTLEHYRPANAGVSHSFELPLVWRYPGWLSSPFEYTLSDHFTTWWTNMAADGSPNPTSPNPSLPSWPKYGSGDTHVVIGETVAQSGNQDDAFHNCDFWDSMYDSDREAFGRAAHRVLHDQHGFKTAVLQMED